MKREDFDAAMAMYAAADQRAAANLIELLTATLVCKLAPPAGTDVATVTISPPDIEEMLRTHHFEARYVEGEMTVFVTPLSAPKAD